MLLLTHMDSFYLYVDVFINAGIIHHPTSLVSVARFSINNCADYLFNLNGTKNTLSSFAARAAATALVQPRNELANERVRANRKVIN